jgi:type II secretory pathway component PulM
MQEYDESNRNTFAVEFQSGGVAMRRIWKSQYGREIALILIVKIVLILSIWWVFFRAPQEPTPEQVSRALLSSQPRSDR